MTIWTEEDQAMRARLASLRSTDRPAPTVADIADLATDRRRARVRRLRATYLSLAALLLAGLVGAIQLMPASSPLAVSSARGWPTRGGSSAGSGEQVLVMAVAVSAGEGPGVVTPDEHPFLANPADPLRFLHFTFEVPAGSGYTVEVPQWIAGTPGVSAGNSRCPGDENAPCNVAGITAGNSVEGLFGQLEPSTVLLPVYLVPGSLTFDLTVSGTATIRDSSGSVVATQGLEVRVRAAGTTVMPVGDQLVTTTITTVGSAPGVSEGG